MRCCSFDGLLGKRNESCGCFRGCNVGAGKRAGPRKRFLDPLRRAAVGDLATATPSLLPTTFESDQASLSLSFILFSGPNHTIISPSICEADGPETYICIFLAAETMVP
jgi:hypothetical protein